MDRDDLSHNKVSVFVVGAPKAGTTTLFDIIRKSGDVALPIVKEPNFFCDDVKASWDVYQNTDNFVRDWSNLADKSLIGQYHSTRIDDHEQYELLFLHSLHHQVKMDFSTSYFRSRHAPEAIYNYNPCAKIVMIVRCPVERAWSHYKQDLRVGYHNQSFLTCLESEKLDISQGRDSKFSYIRDSAYAESYERYNKLFGSILVIDFDQFIADQQTVIDQFCDFCSVDRLVLDENVSSNTAREGRFFFLGPITKSIILKNLLKRFMPSRVKTSLRKILYKEAENEAVDHARYSRFFEGQDIRAKPLEIVGG